MRTDQIKTINDMWDKLNDVSLEDIAKRTEYELVDGQKLRVPFFKNVYIVDLKAHSFIDEKNGVVLEKYSIILPLLYYIVNSKEGLSPSEKWITEKNLKQGAVFFVGNHALPEKPLLDAFGKDVDLYEKAGKSLGAESFDKGDVAFKFMVFPKVPVIIAVWEEDEEFPASVKYLFDPTIEEYFPKDIIHGLSHVIVSTITSQK